MTHRFDNGVELELLTSGSYFVGIGEVRCGGDVLRSGQRPMFVEIRNPDGIELSDYEIVAEERTERILSFDLRPKQRSGGAMEWMVHATRPRYNTSDWSRPATVADDTLLQLRIWPVTREVGKLQATGFAYQYHYRSASIPIYRICDRGTWEPGGHAVGNEFWMRNCFAPGTPRFDSVAQHYSTEWFLPTAANPNVVQFLPLQTELQGFTFTCHDRGVLWTWATRVAHVRSLFEKSAGSDLIVHYHEHCDDLGRQFSTAPVEVLWIPGCSDRIGRINQYEQIRTFVSMSLHGQIGMKPERLDTYGIIEEWENADLDRYRKEGLPKLANAGVKWVFLSNHFQNNMNVWGVSNMCCTVDYKVAEEVGEDRLRDFCAAAKARDMHVEMWGNTAISTLTYMFWRRNGESDRIRFLPRQDSIMEALATAEHPFVRTPSNAMDADHYTPVFAVLNLRDPVVRDYWIRRWGHAHDHLGLEGMFLDSSFNLSSDKFHWVQNAERAARQGVTADQTDLLGFVRGVNEPTRQIISQYRAHLDLMVQMQRMGYRYAGEDLGVFGVHRHGPKVHTRLDCLWLWPECLAEFNAAMIRNAGGDPDDVFFRGLAYRMVWIVFWNIASGQLSFHAKTAEPQDQPTPWHLAVLRGFSAVTDLMVNRTVLPEERGVVYRADDCDVYWSFRDHLMEFAQPSVVRDVLQDVSKTMTHLQARKHAIYVIQREPHANRPKVESVTLPLKHKVKP